jgi:adenylate cyclase
VPDIFLSYNREDQATARRFAEAFQAEGFEVWWDSTLRTGEAYDEVTEKALKTAKAVVVLWSRRSVESRWVRSEATLADRNKTLVPVTIEPCERPVMFELTQTADLSNWDGAPTDGAWLAFLDDVKRFLEAGPSRSAQPTPAAGSPLQTAAPRPDRLSVCVLPFANMSDDPQQEYFSDGISEDIITDLSKVSTLSVVARNTAFTFKGRNVDVRRAARELGVSHILEGSVRKAGGRVRISAQLIDGAAGDHVWAERYDRKLEDIFELQDEISQAIVAALRLRLAPAEKKAIEKRGTTSAEAYDLYLMARQYREAGNSDARKYGTVVRLCERATAMDPLYAQAWALMAAAGMILDRNFGGTGDGGAAAIERALSIDPNLGDAHALRARELYQDGHHREAFAELDLALRQAPESYEVNYQAGSISYQDRRFADAVRYYGKATQLSEVDLASPGTMISAYAALGDREAARSARAA